MALPRLHVARLLEARDDQVLRDLVDAAAERLGDCGMVFAEPQPLVDDEPAHIR